MAASRIKPVNFIAQFLMFSLRPLGRHSMWHKTWFHVPVHVPLRRTHNIWISEHIPLQTPVTHASLLFASSPPWRCVTTQQDLQKAVVAKRNHCSLFTEQMNYIPSRLTATAHEDQLKAHILTEDYRLKVAAITTHVPIKNSMEIIYKRGLSLQCLEIYWCRFI